MHIYMYVCVNSLQVVCVYIYKVMLYNKLHVCTLCYVSSIKAIYTHIHTHIYKNCLQVACIYVFYIHMYMYVKIHNDM